MKRLEGKIALVTGSDSGIGQAIAIDFAKEGAYVAVCYHTDHEGAEKTVESIEQIGQRAMAYHVDLTKEADVHTLFTKVINDFGDINILVNNAGIVGARKPLIEMSHDEFDLTIKSDLYSAFYTCRSFGQHKKLTGGGGKIINISSVHEDMMSKNMSDYNAAKGGLKNLTRSLALELAEHKINVNNIGPGVIVTPMNAAIMESEAKREETGAKVAWKRVGYPEEIAKLATFLASKDADYVTGSTYFMDGGLMQQPGAEV